jgi:hypothetical protein
VDPDQCVQEMREKVKEETSLTVSAGIAPNKVGLAGALLRSICSKRNCLQMLAKVGRHAGMQVPIQSDYRSCRVDMLRQGTSAPPAALPSLKQLCVEQTEWTIPSPVRPRLHY